MNTGDSKELQDQHLREMNYPKSEDIFERGEALPLNGDGEVGAAPRESLEMNLDVPGAELDDAMEKIGAEDEENNYWSLGGDNHEDLEQSEDL